MLLLSETTADFCIAVAVFRSILHIRLSLSAIHVWRLTKLFCCVHLFYLHNFPFSWLKQWLTWRIFRSYLSTTFIESYTGAKSWILFYNSLNYLRLLMKKWVHSTISWTFYDISRHTHSEEIIIKNVLWWHINLLSYHLPC